MRKPTLIVFSAAIAAFLTWAADWPSVSGNPQRDGWAKNEKAFTRENAKNIELLYKFHAENQTKSLAALTSPIVNGMLITYLGFKEMLVFGGSQDNVYSVDADLNRQIWKTHFEYKADKPAAAPTAVCPGGLTAALAMPGSSTAAGRGFGAPPGRAGVPPGRAGAPTPAPGRGPTAAAPPTLPPGAGRGPAGLFATGFGRSGAFVAISSDGYMHPLNTSTGSDKIPAVRFLPPNSKVSGLNINDNVIYAATEGRCGGNPNALYALDMSGDEHKLSTLETNGAGAAGSGGTAIAADGTVYAQFPDGSGEMAGKYNDTVVAMSKDLKVKDYFTPSGGAPSNASDGITPLVFQWKGKEVVVAGSRAGRVYLLDAESLGGTDHHTPLAQTEPVAVNGFHGTFSSWEDADNTRWIYASLRAPASASAGFAKSNGDAPHGSIIAFRVVERNDKPALEPIWISKDMMAPAPTVTANGLVFALSSGESGRDLKDNGSPYSVAEREKMASHAVLYVLDSATGAELYSSGNMATSFSHNSGLAVANRRIYFTTHDNYVFALGFLAEQPQLTGK